MAGGSVGLKVESDFAQYYYGSLKPFENYVPIKSDFSDLIEKEKDKGFTSWEFFLKQAIKNAA